MGRKSYFLGLFGVAILGIYFGSQVPLVPWFILVVGAFGLLWLYLEYRGFPTAEIVFWVVIVGLAITFGHLAKPSIVWDHPVQLELEGIVTDVTHLNYDIRVLVRLSPSSSMVAVHLPLETDVEVGDRLRFQGVVSKPPKAPNPGVFCYATYLERRNVYGLCYPTEYTVAKNEQKLSLLARVRYRMEENIKLHVDQPGLVLALVLGDRSELNQEQVSNWSTLGISHLLAISGMHVGLVAMDIGWLVNRLPFRSFVKVILIQCVLLLYVLLSGSGTSAQRALLAFVLGGFTSLREAAVDPLQIWAVVGFGLLLISPQLAFSLGFILSFLASGGILLWGPSLQFPWKKGLNLILQSLAISVAAQISTAPVLIYTFGELPLLGPVSTLLFLPLVLILIVGGLGTACGFGSLGFGYLVNFTIGFVGFLEHLLVPRAHVWKPQGLLWMDWIMWWLFFFYGGWILRRPRITRPRQSLRHLAVCTAALLCFTGLPPSVRRPLEVTAVNVGQDCYYIRTPFGQHILFDRAVTPYTGRPGEKCW